LKAIKVRYYKLGTPVPTDKHKVTPSLAKNNQKLETETNIN